MAASQASRRHPSGASGPAGPISPPTPPGWPSRLFRCRGTWPGRSGRCCGPPRGPHAQPGAQPAGGRGRQLALVGAGGPAGVEGGQPAQPLAVPAVGLALPFQDVLGRFGVAEPVQVLGSQFVHRPWQPRELSGRSRGAGGFECCGGWGGWVEYVFESMAATDQLRTRTQAPTQECGEPFGTVIRGYARMRVRRRLRSHGSDEVGRSWPACGAQIRRHGGPAGVGGLMRSRLTEIVVDRHTQSRGRRLGRPLRLARDL